MTGTANFTDWLAICEVKARYCRTLDTKDWAGYADCFTDDLIMDSTAAGGTISHGRDESIQQVRAVIETSQTAHQVHNPEITFDAEGASAIWAMEDRIAWHPDMIEQMGNLGFTGWGHYRERLTKCADGNWRITHLKLTRLLVDVHKLI